MESNVVASTSDQTTLDDFENQLEKCAICLQVLNKSKSYTSQCFHSFCFECIIQWSAIRLSCPLCKTPFDRILFNVKSCVQYKQFNVKPIVQSTSTQDIINYMPNETPTLQEVKNENVSKASWVVNKEQAPLEFRILVYVNKWFCCPNQINHQLKIIDLSQEFTLNDDENKPEHSVFKRSNLNIYNEIQSSLTPESLYLISYRPVKSFRKTSPEFYRKNVVCTHRLIQFIYRELKAIACVMSSSKLPNYSGVYLNQATRAKLMQLIISELKRNTINSEQFERVLTDYMSPNDLVKHFAHELSVYCGSTSNSLVDYDAKCVYYSNQTAANKEFNKMIKLPYAPLPVNLNKYRLNSKPIVSTASTSNQAQDNESELILINDDFNAATPDYQQIIDDSQESDDSDSSTGSSYCEFIEVSPKRSPEYIVLQSSSSDSSPPRRTRRLSPKNTSPDRKQRDRRSPSRKIKRKHRHSDSGAIAKNKENEVLCSSRASRSESDRTSSRLSSINSIKLIKGDDLAHSLRQSRSTSRFKDGSSSRKSVSDRSNSSRLSRRSRSLSRHRYKKKKKSKSKHRHRKHKSDKKMKKRSKSRDSQ